MYFLLILFFGSLLGITFMIGRKLMLLQSGEAKYREENVFEAPLWEEWKHLTVKKIRGHGYTGLVATVRFYVWSTTLVKNKYQEVKIKVKKISDRKSRSEGQAKREVNGFLKMISEYKHKIREIKHKIKEEEKNL